MWDTEKDLQWVYSVNLCSIVRSFFVKYWHELRGKQVTDEMQGLTVLRAALNGQKVNRLVYV